MRYHLFTFTCAVLLLCAFSTHARADATSPLQGDALYVPGSDHSTRTIGTSKRYNPSAFLAGTIAVQVIFVESDGSIQPSTEDWTASERDAVEQQIVSGLDWWNARVPNARVDFQALPQTVSIGYEPISLSLKDESKWVGSALTELGFTGRNHFEQAYSAAEALRTQYHADWATTIFVVNSANDADGRFADDHFAYAYVNGPFLVVTSDAGVYGTNQLAAVVSHELGHIFGALDQYESAATPCSLPSGYLAVPSTNSQAGGCGSKFICVMLEPITAYQSNAVDESALGQVGYRDSDGDGIPDPLDTTPQISVTLSQEPGKRPTVTVQAIDQPYPSLLHPTISINPIEQIAYRVDGSEWYPLPANDGAFDSTEESAISELALYDGGHTVDFRATNRAGNLSPIISRTINVQGVGTAPTYQVIADEAQNTQIPVIRVQAPAGFSMRVSTSPEFDDADWQAVDHPLPPSTQWVEGKHTVYISLRDANKVETPIVQRAITLDWTAPSGSASLIPANEPMLITTFEDLGSGVAAMQIIAGDAPQAWQDFVPSLVLPTGTLPSGLRLRDRAGNISAVIRLASPNTVLLPLIQAQ